MQPLCVYPIGVDAGLTRHQWEHYLATLYRVKPAEVKWLLHNRPQCAICGHPLAALRDRVLLGSGFIHPSCQLAGVSPGHLQDCSDSARVIVEIWREKIPARPVPFERAA